MIRLFPLALLALLLGACSKAKKGDPTQAADWRPENASVARHITSVHHFRIAPDKGSHMQVERDAESGRVICKFRDDVLETLGGEKALFVLGWDDNPHESSRHEYLFFLEALHAFLVLNHPQWDGGEGESRTGSDLDKLTDAGQPLRE